MFMSPASSRPLIVAVAWASGSYFAALGLQLAFLAPPEISVRALLLVLAGALYTNIFEHIWHRFAMHSRRPDPRHALHHRIFYGNRFQTTDPAALREIVTAWYIFPLLLASIAGFQPQDDVRVCLDPDGHPFCLYLPE